MQRRTFLATTGVLLLPAIACAQQPARTLWIGDLSALQPQDYVGAAASGVRRAAEDLMDVCGRVFVEVSDPAAADIRVVAQPTIGGSFGGQWADPVLILNPQDRRGWGEQRTFQIARHELGHALSLAHSNDPASPMHSNAPAGPWDAATVRTLQGLYGPPSHRRLGMDEAGLILALNHSDNVNAAALEAHYAAYLARPFTEADAVVWLPFAAGSNHQEVEALIAASVEAKRILGGKEAFLRHAFRIVLGAEPTAAQVAYYLPLFTYQTERS